MGETVEEQGSVINSQFPISTIALLRGMLPSWHFVELLLVAERRGMYFP